MKQIICSHGFGVDATDRGLFTDIAQAFPKVQFTMFDYNLIDTTGNMTVQPLETQARLLNDQLKKANGEVVLLCHSQGCVTAAMTNLENVSQLIFLAPPDDLDIPKFVKVFGGRPGAQFNPEGTSSIPRRDGTVTYIGKAYLESVAKADVQALFVATAQKVPTTIIRAAEDEIVGQTQFKDISANVVTLPGTHDFGGEARERLISELREILG